MPIAVACFMVLAALVLGARCVLFSDTEVVFALLSSVAGGFLAVAAFFGSVAVFKLQLLEGEISQAAEKLRLLLKECTDIPNLDFMGTAALADAAQGVETGSGMIGGMQIAVQREILGITISRRNRMRNHFVDFSLLCFASVLLAFAGMPLTAFFVSAGWLYATAIYTVGILLLVFTCLSVSFGLIKEILGYSYVAKAEGIELKTKGGNVKITKGKA